MEKKEQEYLLREMLKLHSCSKVKDLNITDVTNKETFFKEELTEVTPHEFNGEVYLETTSGKRIMKIELTKTTLELLGIEAKAYSKDAPTEAIHALQPYIADKCEFKTFPLITLMDHNVYLLKATSSMYEARSLEIKSSYGFVSNDEYFLNELGHHSENVDEVRLGCVTFHIAKDTAKLYQRLKGYNCCVSINLRGDKYFLKALELLGYKPLFWNNECFYGVRNTELCKFEKVNGYPQHILIDGVCYSWYPELKKYFPVLEPDNTPVHWCELTSDKGWTTSLIAGLVTDKKYFREIAYLSPAKANTLYKKHSKYNTGISVYVNMMRMENYPFYSEPKWMLENWQSVLVYHNTTGRDLWFHTKNFENQLVAYAKKHKDSVVLMHDINMDALDAIGHGVTYAPGVSPIAIALSKDKGSAFIEEDISYPSDHNYQYIPVNSLRKWS